MANNSYTPIDPSAYARMDFVQVPDDEAILAARMASYVEAWTAHDPPMAAIYDVASLEFDPHKIVQETCTVYHSIVLNRINQSVRAATTAFATGRDLDAIATRLPFAVAREADEIYDYATALYPERVAKDAKFRLRMWLAPFKLSRGSTAEGYAFDTLSLVPNVRDVTVQAVRTPQQVSSVVTLLMSEIGPDGVPRARLASPAPTKAEILAAFKVLNVPDIVENTDVVGVRACAVIDRAYTFNLFFRPYTDHGALMAQIQAAGTTLFEDTLFYLGMDHGRQQVEGLCNLPGIHHVELEGFDGEVIEAAPHQVIRATFEIKDKGIRS